jgi:hypothetical protein
LNGVTGVDRLKPERGNKGVTIILHRPSIMGTIANLASWKNILARRPKVDNGNADLLSG